ncbi:unnamed protein product [Leptosia nina]|uniref:Uncharacterized protein n=1 Tax=Leptosia nina TaxID=320188 RepID=A0AAV1JRK2_9NEOP
MTGERRPGGAYRPMIMSRHPTDNITKPSLLCEGLAKVTELHKTRRNDTISEEELPGGRNSNRCEDVQVIYCVQKTNNGESNRPEPITPDVPSCCCFVQY